MILPNIVKVMRNADSFVGLLSDGRKGIFHGIIPIEASLPAVSLNVVFDKPLRTLSGNQQDRDARIRIKVVAREENDAILISNTLEELLEGAVGLSDGINIKQCQYEGAIPDFDAIPDINRIINEFSIKYSKGG